MLCGVLLTLLACAAARAESVFTVNDVPIDAEAASSAEARELAIAEGQHAAWEILLRRLTVESAGARPPAPSVAALANMVGGYSIGNELVSATRYRAALTVDFDPRAVRRLLRDHDIAYAETVSKPVLVVAVHLDRRGAQLWGEANRWRRAWEERAPRGGLVPLLLPLGDVIDLGTVDAAQALASDKKALTALAGRYGTSELVVVAGGIPELGTTAAIAGQGGGAARDPEDVAAEPADAEASDDPSVAGLAMTLSVRRITAGGNRGLDETLIGRAGETRGALFGRVVEWVVAVLEHDWKLANLVRYDRERALRVAVPVRSLSDWVAIRRRLEGLAVIAAVDIGSLSRSAAALTLRHFGTPDQLRLALEQADLVLASVGDGWVLHDRDAVPAPRMEGTVEPAARAPEAERRDVYRSD